MKATEVLIEEHEIILKVLDVIEAMTGKIGAGERIETAHLEKIVDIIVNFADRCHHAKEEGIFFPAMVRAGFPERQGPIAVMLQEHAEGREYVRVMKEALERVAPDGMNALNEFARNAAEYAVLLRNHIHKENTVLFKMADDRIGRYEQEEIFKAFEKVERDEIGLHVHEKYHEMVHDLVKKYLR